MPSSNENDPVEAQPLMPVRVNSGPGLTPPSVRLGDTPPGWRVQERAAARLTGGVPTPGSGSGRMKGDVRTALHVIEYKTTEKATLALKREWLAKVRREATVVGQHPVLFFGFDGEEREDWAALPAEDFQSIVSVLTAVAEGDLDEAQALLQVFL